MQVVISMTRKVWQILEQQRPTWSSRIHPSAARWFPASGATRFHNLRRLLLLLLFFFFVCVTFHWHREDPSIDPWSFLADQASSLWFRGCSTSIGILSANGRPVESNSIKKIQSLVRLLRNYYRIRCHPGQQFQDWLFKSIIGNRRYRRRRRQELRSAPHGICLSATREMPAIYNSLFSCHDA